MSSKALKEPAGKSTELPAANLPQPEADHGYIQLTVSRGESVFNQGDLADAVYRLESGKAKLTVVSGQGKGAVIALLGPGDFFGEGCLAGQVYRACAASAMTDCIVLRMGKEDITLRLRDDRSFADVFLHYLLARNLRIEEDLADRLVHSSERRLARMLLLLADSTSGGELDPAAAKMSQEMLAEIVGTTRARVNFFMNKFRRLGLIEYDGTGLRVNGSRLRTVLRE
jgi:CRP/FNR family transcriptional regulator, cyclic AMP receptor protein